MLTPRAIAEDLFSRRQRLRAMPALGLLIAILFSSAGGCTRTYYRKQADQEVTHILDQKNMPGRWGLPQFRLEYDPRSRYFDPTNPDHPPMPPDDPNSHVFMHVVDGMKGARNYHADGDLKSVPNPHWRQQLATYADVSPDGTVNVTLDGAMRMAVIHDPDYRQQLEELYFSALDVSTERFRFDTQFFGGLNPVNYVQQAKNAPGAGGSSTSTLGINDNLRFQRQFAAGGQLLVGFINTMMFQFAGPDTNTNTTLLNFSFIQPLLRAGGRRFILEQLTIVERGMLANLRAFERYRQGFYTNLAIGDGGVTGAQRRGGFFGGTGLTGFTGQGSTGFGGVGDATGFGRGGTGNAVGGNGAGSGFVGGGAGTVGGYVGILQQSQQINNSELNFDAQKRMFKLLNFYLAAGTITRSQVDQFEQNMLTTEATLLQTKVTRDNAKETFLRTQIGLPPDLPLALDDSLIRQFQFTAPDTNRVYDKIADFADEFGDLPKQPDLDVLVMALDRLDALRNETRQALLPIGDELKIWDARREARKRTLSPQNIEKLDAEFKKFKIEFDSLANTLNEQDADAAKIRAGLAPNTREQTADRLAEAIRRLSNLIQDGVRVQSRSRLESVVLEPVVLDSELALQVARANRYDWMNNRAALVDSWRLIAFNARTLLATLNIVLDGNISTRGDNPVKFQASTGTLRAGLQFDAPFTRLVERNNYRSALIEYQRDRRTYIQYEDGVNQSLRQTLRTLKQLEENLEIQRSAVAIALNRVEQTRLVIDKPPEAIANGTSTLGPTAAFDLLTALNDLQGAQNNFMSVWLNHYASRMILVRELGLMQLDDNNLWIDRPLDELLATAEMCPPEELPPDVPQSWFDALDRLPPTGEEVPGSVGSGGDAPNELPAPPTAPPVPMPPAPVSPGGLEIPRLNAPNGSSTPILPRGARRRRTDEHKTAADAPDRTPENNRPAELQASETGAAKPIRSASTSRVVDDRNVAPAAAEKPPVAPTPPKPPRAGKELFDGPPIR